MSQRQRKTERFQSGKHIYCGSQAHDGRSHFWNVSGRVHAGLTELVAEVRVLEDGGLEAGSREGADDAFFEVDVLAVELEMGSVLSRASGMTEAVHTFTFHPRRCRCRC